MPFPGSRNIGQHSKERGKGEEAESEKRREGRWDRGRDGRIHYFSNDNFSGGRPLYISMQKNIYIQLFKIPCMSNAH